MKFNIDDYNSKYYMICETHEESDAFREYLTGIARTWLSGTPYVDKDLWNVCMNEYGSSGGIGYRFQVGTWSPAHLVHSCYALYYGQFEWGDDLNIDVFEMSFDAMFGGET